MNGAEINSGEDPANEAETAQVLTAPIYHRKRGTAGRTWCGSEKAQEERWAQNWGAVTCDGCKEAKASQSVRPKPDPEEVSEDPFGHITDGHRAMGEALTAPLMLGIGAVQERRGYHPPGPGVEPAVSDWATKFVAAADRMGWLENAASSPWFAVATSSISLVYAVTLDQKPIETENDQSEPTEADPASTSTRRASR